MKNTKNLIGSIFTAAVLAIAFAGCESGKHESHEAHHAASAAPAAAATAPAPAATAAAAPAPVTGPIRIKAGSPKAFTDSAGNVWMADQGFEGGETVDCAPDMEIANTKDPGLYRSERYGMPSFTWPLPNGKYIVKLHFAETFEGITKPGERVFSFNVQGHEFKDFDIWVKAGGPQKAYIETVPIEVTDGKLHITFTPNVENPEINAIEIDPVR